VLIATVFFQSFVMLGFKFSIVIDGMMSYLFVLMAVIFMMLRTVMWQRVLQKNELSDIYPYTSISPLLVFFYAVFIFDESVNLNNIFGLILVFTGIYIISSDDA